MTKVNMKKYTLDVDLKQGVVPISKAASSLAALIKRSRANHQPIIVTQKGFPSGVILDVELFTALRQVADLHRQAEQPVAAEEQSTDDADQQADRKR